MLLLLLLLLAVVGLLLLLLLQGLLLLLLLLLSQDVLFQLLQLRHILLQRSQLLLVGYRILLQRGQGSLILLLQLSLLQDLLLKLLVKLLQLLQLSQLLAVLLQGRMELGLLPSLSAVHHFPKEEKKLGVKEVRNNIQEQNATHSEEKHLIDATHSRDGFSSTKDLNLGTTWA